jgi:hypothetical protein
MAEFFSSMKTDPDDFLAINTAKPNLFIYECGHEYLYYSFIPLRQIYSFMDSVKTIYLFMNVTLC